MTTRQEYVDMMKKQLDEWNEDLDHLEAEVNRLQGQAKEKYDNELASFREQIKSMESNLQEMKASRADDWERFKTKSEQLRDAFVHSFNYFKSQLKEIA